MKRYYIKCISIRRGLTGREFLGQHIDEVFPPTKLFPLFDNEFIQFGYLEGNDESLLNVISMCETIFSIKRLFIEEFRGAAKLYHSGDLDKLFTEHSIEPSSDILSDVKSYKISLLKESLKKDFQNFNDSISNIFKEILLLYEYRKNLNKKQLDRLNAVIEKAKSIYDVETCLTSLEKDVESLNTYIPEYYSVKKLIQSCTTIEEIESIDLIGSLGDK